MKTAVIATVLALAGVALPGTAHADCGDPEQPACAGPVPTVDQVVAIMAELTDPNIPAANKGNIVTPGFTPEEAGTIDDHLHKIEGPALPLPFIVTDIQAAPNNFAGATVSTGGNSYQRTYPAPIVLVNQGGHWLITHDTAMHELSAFWANGSRTIVHVP
ncbi:hypothetical protein [Mycobacterium sp.]|uniref:hypothetical protein n=1 Tax=Mycobacterium sp. TaxID=1785 RepID=UPI0031D58682